MKETLPDPEQVLQQVANVTLTCLSLKRARLEAERDQLRTLFQRYETGKSPPADAEALLIGFQEKWVNAEYEVIVKVGEKISSLLLKAHPELQAYVEFAKRKLQ